MTKLKLLMVALLCTSQFLWAQNQSTGRVVDAKTGTPLPGVTVTVKNRNINTLTNADGSFSINAPGKSTLIFSYVGYLPVESAPGNALGISLTPGENALSEIVVVGYGTRLRKDITGSVARVSAKELANTPVTSFENAIQGRAAGVLVEQQGGKLGQGIKVRIRGSASVSAGNEPFYVVDGIPVVTTNLSSNGAPTSPLADINPNDIESIEILKDASAAAIYGSRGSNGVVLITTKKGKAGKTKIDFGYYTGNQKPTRMPEFMNAQEYVTYMRQAAVGAGKQDFKAGGYATLQAAIDAENSFLESRLLRYSAGNTDYQTYKVSTDWQSMAFQDAPMSQYDLNLSGGNDKTTFYIGGQYLDQAGIILRNSLKRYTGRVNVENKVNDWLSVGINMSFARSLNKRISNDNQFSTPLQIVALSPITPAIDPRTGFTSGALDLATGLPNTNYPVYYNPMLSYEAGLYNTTVNRTLGNVFGNVSITRGLSFRTELGMDQLNQNEESYNGRLTRRNSGATFGTGFNAGDQILNINTNNYFRYNTHFREVHSLEATAGMSYQNYKLQSNSVSGRDFPSDDFKKLQSAATNTAYSSSETQYSFLGYFARANYKYSEKYLLALSGRYDASSRFGQNNRWGFFPAASVGWIVTEENFLSHVNWLSFLKLKASWGLTGNAEIGNFASRGLFSGDASYGGNPGTRPSQIPNPDLKWETTASTDAGVEIGVVKNRISLEVDYYTRKTKDLLLNVEVPGTSGFSTQLRNVGNLENKGIEFTLNTNNIVGKKFKWSSSMNFAANKNKITNLGGQQIGTLNVAKEGEALGVFYSKEFAGADPANGDALYYKNTLVNGKRDRTTTNDYNLAENVVIGDPNPDFIYGFRNNFSYMGLELDVLLQGVYGNEVFAGGGQYMSASGSNGFDNQTRDQLAAWKNPGDITMVPEARLFYANGVNNSSRYIYDASYLRVKAVTLSYTLPASLTSRLKISSAKFYLRGQNLFTFTKYPLWDPEVNADYSATNIVQGRDFYSVPQAKTIVIGVNISL
ncbi:MAG: TonB-dependent receptor [Chitinophagaceae bacterium]|nr:TonB-dependent receptor [Chitinophagaceae bacterium]